jgi:Raf kinase inhibitor-like YbhB/YbcL family protein
MDTRVNGGHPGARFALAAALVAAALAPLARADEDEGFRLRVNSSTFRDGGTLPLSMVDNIVQNGVNVCTADGSAAGNESPELSWEHAPPRTRSFVVVAFDTTASFTHWGMYNISGRTTGLPANAGVPNSTFGQQVLNDFFDVPAYEGPCPPAGVAPAAHQYVFTVYALSTRLKLPNLANFPDNAATLYQALIAAGGRGEVLASASIAGLFSATAAN